MVGYLKKRVMDILYYKHEKELWGIIEKQVSKKFNDVKVSGSHAGIFINIPKGSYELIGLTPADVIKKLKQILGVNVYFAHDSNICGIQSWSFRIFYKDL